MTKITLKRAKRTFLFFFDKKMIKNRGNLFYENVCITKNYAKSIELIFLH